MRRTVFSLLAAIVVAAPSACASQNFERAMQDIRSPEDIARFFSHEFTYAMTLPDRAHSPEDTMMKMSGDCDDFAVLASAMLTRMGIENKVLIIRFSGIKIAHAICMWKDKDGYYNFISNQELQRTGQRTIDGAVRKFYPDCAGLASIDPKMYSGSAGENGMSASKSYRGAELMTDLDPRWSSSI